MVQKKTQSEQGGQSDVFLLRHLPGSCPAMVRLREEVSHLNSPRKRDLISSILLRGESGTGKNHLAKIFCAHRRWMIENSRGDADLDAALEAYAARFQEIHLPTLPDQLIESELFGHTKNAFTGALRDKRGLLSGDGVDDILLDEIGDSSPALQAKLLGVIESRQFRRIGGSADEVFTVDARLIMATNKPLEELVSQQKFRDDLYHRVRLFELRVPPLREQRDSIASIARHIETELQRNFPLDPQSDIVPTLTNADLAWACSYAWPGNIRELKLAITRWAFYDGQRSLSDIVSSPAEDASAPSQLVATGDLTSIVSSQLDAALAQGKPAAPTLRAFVAGYERAFKEAVAAWYRAEARSEEQLHILFPAHTNTGSIRNKLSSWRAR